MYRSLHILLLISCFSNSLLTQKIYECAGNEKYENLKQTINDEKEIMVLKLLEKYGDEYRKFGPNKKLVEKLSEVGEKLDDFENNNQILNRKNDDLATEINSLSDELDYLKNQLSNIHTESPSEKGNTDVPVTIEEVEALRNDLNKWVEIAEKLHKNNLTNELMNLPYSISDEILFLEHILSNKDVDSTCIEKLKQELKNTFKELTELLEFDGILKETDELEELSNANKDRANELIKQSEEILRVEKNRDETRKAAEEILSLAREVEKLKSDMDRISSEPDIINTDVHRLLKDNYYDLDAVQKEIDIYQEDIDCYYEYISNCNIRGKITSANCMREKYGCEKE